MTNPPAVKRPRGRPVSTGTTPAKDRQSKTKANLRQAGGTRISANLPPEAVQHLNAIAEAFGFEGRGRVTETVIHALADTAKRLK